jgi:hypothetical protein
MTDRKTTMDLEEYKLLPAEKSLLTSMLMLNTTMLNALQTLC